MQLEEAVKTVVKYARTGDSFVVDCCDVVHGRNLHVAIKLNFLLLVLYKGAVLRGDGRH